MKQKLFYVENDYGCGIRADTTLQKARKQTIEEEGTHHFRSIREATKEDVNWVAAMGGYIPNIDHPWVRTKNE